MLIHKYSLAVALFGVIAAAQARASDINTFAGTGDPGFVDDVPALEAQLHGPRGIVAL